MFDLILAFSLVAVVLMTTALISGMVERSPLSFPFIFLALGVVLSGRGFGVIEMTADSETLEVVAALTLALVLFLDAAQLQVEELGRRWLIPALILGPGTGLIIVFGAVPLALIAGFSWIVAFIGAAVLASTDPVVLRDIVRDQRLPRGIRQILKIEAGMNDLVVLPVILILIAVAGSETGGVGGWVDFLSRLLLLGPAIGFAIGGAGSGVMERVDEKWQIRREHQALFGLGLVLAAYAAAVAVGGDGFLAAFSAGIAVVVLNRTLCDCFLEYGETTAEIAMLLSFILFGAVLSDLAGSVDLLAALVVAALVIFVIRPGILGLVLSRSKMSWQAHALVGWFGPRGLNSLLLALLAVQAGLPEAELLLATVGIVVFASVIIHGGTALPAVAWYSSQAAREALSEEREGSASGLFEVSEADPTRTSVEELQLMLESDQPPIILDVRTRGDYLKDKSHIPGDVRVRPDDAVEWSADQDKERAIVAYCT